MPEGDTIFRAARTLHRALAGKTVTRFETVLPKLQRVHDDEPITGRVIESIEARGKWNLMRFSGDLVLLTHMLMNGSWHIYRPGEAWQKSRSNMRVVVGTEDFVAVGFNVPVAEFHDSRSLARHPALSKLGEDLLAETFDARVARENLLSRADEELGVALLNQRVMAGIGNVYKSEICFACGVHPFEKVSFLNAAQVGCLLQTAVKYLAMNVKDGSGDGIVTYTGFRRTTGRSDPGARLWVYGRRNEACRKCGAKIQSRKQGEDARVTFWCPRCQPLVSSALRISG